MVLVWLKNSQTKQDTSPVEQMLDDYISTVVSFRMVVFDLGCGGRRPGNVAVAVLRQDLAMERATADYCAAAEGFERTRARGTPGLRGLVHNTRNRYQVLRKMPRE